MKAERLVHTHLSTIGHASRVIATNNLSGDIDAGRVGDAYQMLINGWSDEATRYNGFLMDLKGQLARGLPEEDCDEVGISRIRRRMRDLEADHAFCLRRKEEATRAKRAHYDSITNQPKEA